MASTVNILNLHSARTFCEIAASSGITLENTPMRAAPLASLALLLVVAGCAGAEFQHSPVPTTSVRPNGLSYPVADSSLGESLYQNEQVLSGQIAASIEQSVREQYRNGNARRDAHPKAHGCVTAEFHVNDSLAERFATGIFIPGKTYQAWIRFSNGSQDASRSDSKGDARGMAIKLIGVPGKKLLENESNATTQDFIMINHPVFFANDPQRYLSFIKKINSDSFFEKLAVPFALGTTGSLIAWETISSKISNPLHTRYWSMVPYQLGAGREKQAVKFSARSCSSVVESIPAKPSHDYLRDALRNTLEQSAACMEFLVQPRTGDSMDVEDSMVEWKESEAPFYQVATIHIPRQGFDTPEQNQFCENLSFSPWHALPEHRPLGAVNRLRKVIYEDISRVRHEMNSIERHEPQTP
ncbi:catalase family protein [soil metagenome]